MIAIKILFVCCFVLLLLAIVVFKKSEKGSFLEILGYVFTVAGLLSAFTVLILVVG